MENQHLPITLRASTNTDRRSFDLGSNQRRNLTRNAFHKYAGHARAIQRHGIAHQLFHCAQVLSLHLVSAHDIDRLRRQPNVPGHRNLRVGDAANQVSPLLPTLDLHHFRPAFLHKARCVAHGVRSVNLIRPVRHIRHKQRILHAAAHGLHVVQHLVHGDRERVLIAQHGLRERIAHQHHLNARLVDNTRGREVVGSQATNGFVSEFLFPQSRGRNLMARLANRGETHDVLQCPSGSAG